MMKTHDYLTKSVILVILLIMTSISMFAQDIELKTNARGRELLNGSTLHGFKSTFSFNRIESARMETESGDFSAISIANTVNMGEIGSPSLPVARELVAVPFGSEPVVKVVNYSTTDYNLNDYGIERVYPQQPSYSKDSKNEDIRFRYNEKAYQAKRNMGKAPKVTFELLGTMRGVQIGALQVEPVDYNPGDNVIRVYNDIQLEVLFENADVVKTQETLLESYSPYFDVVYNSMFNANAVKSVYDDHADLFSSPVKMLVVANRMFEDALQPWITWKTEKGFSLTVAYTDEIGTSSSSIKTYIRQQYDSNKPTFLVIVGDEAQVAPSESGETETGCVTDLYYASVDGDEFPDMYHSRMSCETVQQLTNLIHKVLQYEQYTMPDPSYLDNALLIAGADDEYNPKYGKPQIQYASNYYFNEVNGYSNVYEYLGPNYDGCYSHLSNGVGMINYTAHGSEVHFYNPMFSISNVDNLTNTDKYFYTIANCCLTGDWGYDDSQCLGEAMICGDEKGAWGYVGSCPVTYWQEDFWFAVGATRAESEMPSDTETTMGAYEALWNDGSYSALSSVPYLGNLAVAYAHSNAYGYTTSTRYYFEAYHTLGDGSVMPYKAQPSINSVSHLSVFPMNKNSYTIKAAPGSYVGITQNGILLGAGLIDASGTSDIQITPVTASGDVKIVVSHPKHIPYTANVPARNVGGAVLAIESYTPETIMLLNQETPISVTIKNHGVSASSNAVVSISSDDDFVTIVDGSTSVNSLSVNGMTTLSNDLSIKIAENVADGTKFSLSYTITSGTESWTGKLYFTVNVPNVVFKSFDYSGTYVPGETQTVTAKFENKGNYKATNAKIIVSSSNEYITISNATYNVGTLEAGDVATATFDVTISADCPPTQRIILDFLFSADNYVESVGSGQMSIMCLVDFVMNDSKGDGWGSAKLVLEYSDGTPTMELTVEDGSASATRTLQLPIGTRVDVTFNKGGWPWSYESSYYIQYSGGDVIYTTNGNEPSAGLNVSFVVNCGGYVLGPDAPANLIATATSQNSISLSWNSVQNATNYNVYHGNSKIASGLTATTYNVTGLNAAAEYCFTVTAVNADGESVPSLEACDMTYEEQGDDPEPDATQYRIKDTGTNKYITIFNNSTHEAGPVGGVGVDDYAESNDQIFTLENFYGDSYYLISASGKYIRYWDWNVDAIDNVQCSSMSGFNFNGGTFKIITSKGYFKVEKPSGYSDYYIYSNGSSGEAATWVLEPIATDEPEPILPSAPTNLTATSTGKNSISLSWNSVQNATSYKVYNSNNLTNPIVANLTSTSYNVTGLNAGTEYCYTVTAVNEAGESTYSSNACAMTDADEPETPSGVCSVDFIMNDSYGDGWNGGYIMVSYGNVQEVLEFTGGSSKSYTLEIPTGSHVSVQANLGGYPYECSYCIQYTDGDEIHCESGSYDYYSNYVISYEFDVDCGGDPTPTLPSVPTGLTATATGQNSISLIWNAVQDAASYNVYRNDSQIASGLTATSYADENLAVGTEYCYTVTAVNEAGESTYSSNACAMTDADEPETPSGVCSVDFIMNDSYGDGWSFGGTAYLLVEFSDGSASQELRMDNGTKTTTRTLDIPQGVTVKVSYNSNGFYFPQQSSFTIQYQGGAEIYNSSSNVDSNNAPINDVHTEFVVDCGAGGDPDNPETPGGMEELVIGTGTNSSNRVPFNNYEYYSWVETVYPQSEIGGAKTIYSLSFQRATSQTSFVIDELNVYMAETTKETHANTSDWTPASELTLVYSGTNVTIGDEEWEKITLDAPFEYGGSKNIVVVMSKKNSRYSGNLKWAYTSKSNTVLHRYSDNYSDYSQHPGNATGSRNDNRANMKMEYVSIVSTFVTAGSWSDANNWEPKAVPADGADIIIQAAATIPAESNVIVNNLTIEGGGVSIEANASLIVNGTLINSDAANLVINDDAQLFQNNNDVPATLNMNIVNPEAWTVNNKDGWQFISSPFLNAKISDFTSVDVYDLYKYNGSNESEEWINHKDIQSNGDSFGSTFESGVGYLASYYTEKIATLSGVLNNSRILDLSGGQLSYSSTNNLANFYLIGNPFSFDMDWNKVRDYLYNVVDGYAVVTGNGEYNYKVDGTIKVGDGFFIKAIGNNPALYYDHGEGVMRHYQESYSYINIIVEGNSGKDNVIINMSGKTDGFPKMKNFNEDVANVFVLDNEIRYGIYNCDANTHEVEVSFDSKQMGNYTISMMVDGEFDKVTLLDRETGIETNMLLEDYTFEALSKNHGNRFLLKMQVNKSDKKHFVYQNGDELFIDAEGSVQIIDVIGRIVYSNDVTGDNNRINVGGFNCGAYIVRVLGGNEIKTEKIVIY